MATSLEIETTTSMEKKFFCIRGYMKSGTNWLGRILKCHPDIDCVGEFHWETFHHALQTNSERIAPGRKVNYTATVGPQLESMIQQSLIRFADPDAIWIGDRTPTTLQPITLSGAPHFVIVRDIRDVLVSRMYHLYNHPRVTTIFDQYPVMKKRLEQFQKDSSYFQNHTSELLDNEEVIRTSAAEWSHFLQIDQQTQQRETDLKVKTIRYEVLHSNFETTAAAMFEFLGCEMPETLPDRIKPGFDCESPNRLNRKGIVGDWKNYMNDECLAWVRDEAGPAMDSLGYN